MVNGQAGKGGTYRPVSRTKYDTNMDAIFNPPTCGCCDTKMQQWVVGYAVFYCPNEACEMYTKHYDLDTV